MHGGLCYSSSDVGWKDKSFFYFYFINKYKFIHKNQKNLCIITTFMYYHLVYIGSKVQNIDNNKRLKIIFDTEPLHTVF